MVTNQNKPLRPVSSHMLQSRDHVLTIHSAHKMALVDFARPGQADGGRQDATLTRYTAKDWTLAPRSPRPPQPFQKSRAKFIEKDDVDATSSRLFLSAANLVSAKLG
jgi:hypothetical protein